MSTTNSKQPRGGRPRFKTTAEQRAYLAECKKQKQAEAERRQKQANAEISNQIYLARQQREAAERKNNPFNIAVTAVGDMITEDLETARVGRIFNKKD